MSRYIARGASAAILSLSASLASAQTPARLSLGDAARLAAARSEATAGARARSAQADARVAQRRAELLPSLASSAQLGTRTYNSASLGLEFPVTPGTAPPFDSRGEVFGPVRTVDFRAQLSQRVVDVPALLRWRASGADADAAHFSATATAQGAAARGAVAYVDVLRAEARIAARTADSALAAELLDMARQQLAAGVAIALDVTRAESQLADARARLIAMRGARERALLALRRELSLPLDAPLALTGALDAPGDPDTRLDDEAVVRDALERRPEVRGALAGHEGARTNARAARAERLPTLALFADHGTTGRNTERLLGTYAYGVQVTVPLFDGIRLESRANEQRAREAEAEAAVRDARLRVETEVRSALVSVATAREEVAATGVRLGLAEREVAQARERFRAGLGSNADVITASIALEGARELAIGALAEYHVARIALATARGMATALP